MSSHDSLLAVHANLWLAGRRDILDGGFPESHGAFGFYESVDFATLRMVAAAGQASVVGMGTGRNAWTETGTLEYDDAMDFDQYCRSVFKAAQGVSRAAVNGR